MYIPSKNINIEVDQNNDYKGQNRQRFNNSIKTNIQCETKCMLNITLLVSLNLFFDCLIRVRK